MKTITTSYNYGNEETEYLFCVKGRPFPCLVSPHLPTPTSTLIDFDLIHKLGLTMTDLQCRKFSFAGHKLRILGKLSTNVQCIIDGTSVGRFHVKALVVKDLERNLDTECVASAKMAAQLQGKDEHCTSSGALSPVTSAVTTPARPAVTPTPPAVTTPSRPAAATPPSTPSPSSSRGSPSPRRSPPGFPAKPQFSYIPVTSPTNYRANNIKLLSDRFADADLRTRDLYRDQNIMNQLKHLQQLDPQGQANYSGTSYAYIMSNGLVYEVGHGRNGCRYDMCRSSDLYPDNCGFNGLTYFTPSRWEPCGEMCQGGWCKCLSNYLSS